MFRTFLNQSSAELAVQVAGAILVLVPILWATLRNRQQTMNNQIDALARKSRARHSP
jgi:hypothetical protein